MMASFWAALRLALLAAAFAAGWEVRSWKDEASQEAAVQAKLDARVQNERRVAGDAATYEEERQSAEQDTTQLLQKVRAAHALHPNTACRLDPDSLRAINSAATGASAR